MQFQILAHPLDTRNGGDIDTDYLVFRLEEQGIVLACHVDGSGALFILGLDPFSSGGELFDAERLQKVVGGIDLIALDRVLRICRGEYDYRWRYQ